MLYFKSIVEESMSFLSEANKLLNVIQEELAQAQQNANAWREKWLDSKNGFPAAVAIQIEEALLTEAKFIADMKRFRLLLTMTLRHLVAQNTDEARKDALIFKDYLDKLEALFNDYSQLANPLENITSANPEELLNTMCARFKENHFQLALNQLMDLTEKYNSVNEVFEKKYRAQLEQSELFHTISRGLGFQGMLIMPAQNLPRYYMPLEEMVKKLKGAELESLNPNVPAMIAKAEDAIQGIKDTIGRRQAVLRAIEQYNQASENKKNMMLRNIITFERDALNSSQKTRDFPIYLNKVLELTFPEYFQLTRKGELALILSATHSKYADVCAALGYNYKHLNASSELIPQRFDANALNRLYQDSQHPLWIILKSIKPIDETFTATQKIQAYAEVAEAIKSKKIGATNKYHTAYQVAQAAIAVAESHPECKEMVRTIFGLQSELGQWIISKTKEQDQSLVRNKLTLPLSSKEFFEVEDEVEPSFVSSSRGSSVSIDSLPELANQEEGLDNQEKEAELAAKYLRESILEEQIEEVDIEEEDPESQALEEEAELAARFLRESVKDVPTVNAQVQEDPIEVMQKKKAHMLSFWIPTFNLTDNEKTFLAGKIDQPNSNEELSSLEDKVKTINKMNSNVEHIIKNISQRNTFFSYAPQEKIKAIRSSYQALSIEEKLELATYTPEKLEEQLQKNDTAIGKFLEAININRGLLPIRITATQKETSTLREFKEQLKTLKEDMAPVIRMCL
jgi:biotin-(acetyl-CoA carboxylase) ligase